ncbi:sensor histidine kinase [Saccharicrinis sp. FJH54]|uniref:sensor histidine kinase n=1 Tax=Saccharicrinis sp. FJH54 TaxID=3344665 RepID=UPI0035D3E9AA
MKKSVIMLLHIGFWLMIWFLIFTIMNLIPMLLPSGDFNPLTNWEAYTSAALTVGILSVPFYIFFFYTKLIIKNVKFLVYPLLLIAPFFIGHVIWGENNSYKYMDALMTLVVILLFGFLGGLFQFFTDWFKKNRLKTELERKNYESNFALLRSQINPHFLFNTLHNIDTLIYDNQDKASKSLVKLSDIMRYMLKDAKLDFVELAKEIEHLESYLSLEKLRLKNEKFLDFTIKGDSNGIKVAPMIMIPFVENAFKHCIDSNIENGIVIKIIVENKKLIFVCNNQYDKTERDKDKVHGIGLETVKKRLDLMYKDKHKLSINPEDSVFKVNLELELYEN